MRDVNESYKANEGEYFETQVDESVRWGSIMRIPETYQGVKGAVDHPDELEGNADE